MEITDASNQYAFWPLLLIITGIAGGIGGSLVLIFLDKIWPKEGVALTILGMKGAGKTTLWNFITNDQLEKSSTAGADTVEECWVEINGSERKIKKSLDISGSPDMVRAEYKNLIEKNDFIIFIFEFSVY